MKPLLKTALALIGGFLLIFILLHSTGLLTQEDIAQIVRDSQHWPKVWVALIIIALLTSDILIPVPGIVVVSLAGFLLGPIWGALCGSIGLTLAGVCGYVLCRIYGYRMLHRIYKDKEAIADMRETFHRHSIMVLLLSRAAPMIPETVSCLAGATHMPFLKYLITFATSCTLYSIIVAFAGSLSTSDDLTPAIIAYFCIMAILWTGWFILKKQMQSKS
ncbi:TVP38/TMEM64 family protein [Rubritalea spongiae]|uniref:TVP38/TMEM64 family protein n=1 Tax=Rubritalea spongiae TaxID=430797 RepID=A0ABW5E307_9BACT